MCNFAVANLLLNKKGILKIADFGEIFIFFCLFFSLVSVDGLMRC